MRDENLRERVVRLTKDTGVLPCVKLKEREDCLPYARAMYDGGARIVEITMTTPGVLDAVERVSAEFGGELLVGVGTVLDAASARAAILRGARLIVNPAVIPEVIRLASRYGVPVYSGAFTATECLKAMEAGAAMVKIFPAGLGGAKYMTNLKMVYPEINLIPSGGVSLENAADFIRCGACAVSGARAFMNREKIREEGLEWLSRRVSDFIRTVGDAKKDRPETP